MYLKQSIFLVYMLRGCQEGIFVSKVGTHLAGGHIPKDMCGMHPAFAGTPLLHAQLWSWDMQPWAGAVLPKSAVASSFCLRGSACLGPVRASDMISGLSRVQWAWQSISPYSGESFVYWLSVWGQLGWDMQNLAISSAGCWVLRAAPACSHTQPQKVGCLPFVCSCHSIHYFE